MAKKNRKNNEKKIRTVHVERITDKDVNNINKVINRTQDKKENEEKITDKDVNDINKVINRTQDKKENNTDKEETVKNENEELITKEEKSEINKILSKMKNGVKRLAKKYSPLAEITEGEEISDKNLALVLDLLKSNIKKPIDKANRNAKIDFISSVFKSVIDEFIKISNIDNDDILLLLKLFSLYPEEIELKDEKESKIFKSILNDSNNFDDIIAKLEKLIKESIKNEDIDDKIIFKIIDYVNKELFSVNVKDVLEKLKESNPLFEYTIEFAIEKLDEFLGTNKGEKLMVLNDFEPRLPFANEFIIESHKYFIDETGIMNHFGLINILAEMYRKCTNLDNEKVKEFFNNFHLNDESDVDEDK